FFAPTVTSKRQRVGADTRCWSQLQLQAAYLAGRNVCRGRLAGFALRSTVSPSTPIWAAVSGFGCTRSRRPASCGRDCKAEGDRAYFSGWTLLRWTPGVHAGGRATQSSSWITVALLSSASAA